MNFLAKIFVIYTVSNPCFITEKNAKRITRDQQNRNWVELQRKYNPIRVTNNQIITGPLQPLFTKQYIVFIILTNLVISSQLYYFSLNAKNNACFGTEYLLRQKNCILFWVNIQETALIQQVDKCLIENFKHSRGYNYFKVFYNFSFGIIWVVFFCNSKVLTLIIRVPYKIYLIILASKIYK